MRRGAKSHLTPEQIEEAKELFCLGWSYGRIGERFGTHYEAIRRELDANYAGERRIQARQRRAPFKRSARAGRENATGISVKEDGAARLAEIPADTRTLTQRLCGDPIPNDPRRAGQHS